MFDNFITPLEYTLSPKNLKILQKLKKMVINNRFDNKHKNFFRTAFLWNTFKLMLVKCFQTHSANIVEGVASSCFMKTLKKNL